MTTQTIECFYSCDACGLDNIGVLVPARTTEDVVDWVRLLTRHLCADHNMRSPHCVPETLHRIKIPIAHADRVGGAAVQ